MRSITLSRAFASKIGCALLLCLLHGPVFAAEPQESAVEEKRPRPAPRNATATQMQQPLPSRNATPPAPKPAVFPPRPLEWKELRKGMELGFVQGEYAGKGLLYGLRFDPAFWNFSLRMASRDGGPFSPAEWHAKKPYVAGINASMYLPDNVTSTGHLREGNHTNNPRTGAKLGAVFTAGPLRQNLPAADILEQDAPGFSERLAGYSLAAQNYRLVNSAGRILWPAGGSAHSTAVVAKDSEGRILFLLCRAPLTPADAAEAFKKAVPDIGVIMYVEGGAQAGMFFTDNSPRPAPPRNGNTTAGTASRTPRYPGAYDRPTPDGDLIIIKGLHSLFLSPGNPEAPLPNLLVVEPKDGRPAPAISAQE